MIDLCIKEMNSENSREFGFFIENNNNNLLYKDNSFSYFSNLFINKFTEAVGFSIVQSYKESDGIVPLLEYHSNTVEVLIPTEDVVLVLANSLENNKNKPDIFSAKALLLRKGCAFVIDYNIWHYAPITNEDSVNTFVIFNHNTSDIDTTKVKLDSSIKVKF